MDEQTNDEQPASAVKFTGPDTITGLAFRFGVPDLHRETFTPESDLCLGWFGKSGRPLLYEHGMDGDMAATVIGRQTEFDVRAEGVWATAQLDANAKYRKTIDGLIAQGKLGYSPGAMAHLARKSAQSGAIKQFPWVELSLTPTPAHPDTLGVYYLKSATAIDHLAAVDVTLPEPLKAALSALDDWADTRDDSPAESYAEEGERVLLAVKTFADRSLDIASMRAKSGRVLSAANRARIAELRERIAASTDQHAAALRELDELLASTDPEADAGKSALWATVFEALASDARRLGVSLP